MALAPAMAQRHWPLVVTATLLILLYTGGWAAYESVRSLRFLVDVIKGNAAMGICAVGLTFVVLSGGIDLSVGSVVALSTVVIGVLAEAGQHPLWAFSVAIAVSLSVGLASGCLIHWFGLPPFLVTLSGMFFARGLAFTLSMVPISIEHSALDWIMDELGFTVRLPGLGRAWVPATALLFLAVLLLGIVVDRSTRFGRNVRAVGGDRQAALLMGVPIGVTTLCLYGLSGLCSGLAGVATTLIDSAGKPNIGFGLELEAIAAVVIGGTALTGGVGNVAGTLMGVLIMGVVRALINLDGRLPSPWHPITVGLLLLAFIVMQRCLLLRTGARGNGNQRSVREA